MKHICVCVRLLKNGDGWDKTTRILHKIHQKTLKKICEIFLKNTLTENKRTNSKKNISFFHVSSTGFFFFNLNLLGKICPRSLVHSYKVCTLGKSDKTFLTLSTSLFSDTEKKEMITRIVVYNVYFVYDKL